jgi:hypothetical protein
MKARILLHQGTLRPGKAGIGWPRDTEGGLHSNGLLVLRQYRACAL